MNIKNLGLRWGLPLLALILALAAARAIIQTKPEQELLPAKQTPASPSPSGVKTGVVAGAGVIQPSSELIAIAAPVPGLIKTIDIKVGDEVKRGQLLFAIDDREALAEVAARMAVLDVARRALDSAKVDSADKAASMKLYESIGDKRAMTEDELTRRRFAVQSANARISSAEASVRQGQAQVAQARTALDLRQVRAPIDGTVLQTKVRLGEFASASPLLEPLVTLGATQPLHVKVDIDESDINRADLRGAATVSPRGAANVAVQATFVRVEPLVVPKKSLTNSANERVDTRVLQVVYQLPDGAKGFFVGQQVDAFVPIANRVTQ